MAIIKTKAKDQPFKIAILGAGVAGICMAIKLKQAGFDDITIYEKADDIGGTWRENTYPGCSCDVPMHMYEYSFEMLPSWTKKFVSAEEIKVYLDHVADKYDVRRHVKFGQEITAAYFNEATGFWELTFGDGSKKTANIFIAASGQLHRARWPDIQGQSQFKGASWHSAQWNHDVDLKGKQVGVIGNGASAIQFVPEIAQQIGAGGSIRIFQRSASWVVERPQRNFLAVEKWLYRWLPWTMNFQRYKIYWQGELLWIAFHKQGEKLKEMANKEMELHVQDEAKRKLLTPDYEPGCKRILFANDWWPAMGQDNVEVITAPIAQISDKGVQTQDGREVEVDVLVYSTGFETTNFLGPMKMTGLANRELKDVWAGGAFAHLGITVSGFPNFFMLYGPNTNLGHNSIIFMIECQANYIAQCAKKMRKNDILYMDVKDEAQEKYNEKVQEDNKNSVYATGCTSWYKTKDGKVTNNWANHTFYYWWKTRRPRFGEFTCRARDKDPGQPIAVGQKVAAQ